MKEDIEGAERVVKLNSYTDCVHVLPELSRYGKQDVSSCYSNFRQFIKYSTHF